MQWHFGGAFAGRNGACVMLHAAATACAVLGMATLASPSIAASTKTTLKTVIPVPNITDTTKFFYDGSYVDVRRRLYYLGDRSTKGIDIVDIRTNKVVGQVAGMFVGQAFNGEKLNNNVSGPNSLEMVGRNELWAGDGDSTIKIIDLVHRKFVATIPTGGKARTDFIVYDPDHKVVLATNKNDSPPFISFIDPKSRKIIAKLEIQAKSLDGVVYDHAQKRYLVSVGRTAENPDGEVDAIDPVKHAVVARFPAPECFPAGLALGPSEHLLVGCSDDAIAAGYKAKTLIMDATNGKILSTINEVGGSNYVTYNPGDKRFYLGARDMTEDGTKNTKKTPYLGIIDAVSMKFIENVPAAPNCKAVAADPKTNEIFMPLTVSAKGPGIGVFSR
jgi:DNA-binding beta-propeller fold protein YncE